MRTRDGKESNLLELYHFQELTLVKKTTASHKQFFRYTIKKKQKENITLQL